jgi:hypothetical protein
MIRIAIFYQTKFLSPVRHALSETYKIGPDLHHLLYAISFDGQSEDTLMYPSQRRTYGTANYTRCPNAIAFIRIEYICDLCLYSGADPGDIIDADENISDCQL